MISILFAIILGIGFTILATQNPGGVLLSFFGSSFSIPVYLFAIICFLVGAFIAMLFNFFDLMGAAFDIDKRDAQIKNVSKSNASLQNQVNNLNIQNTKLKEELNQANAKIREEKINHTKQNVRNFFGHIRHTAA